MNNIVLTKGDEGCRDFQVFKYISIIVDDRVYWKMAHVVKDSSWGAKVKWYELIDIINLRE